jgi:ubiquinone/menaquinone biosynthesis C-methylase UbiE
VVSGRGMKEGLGGVRDVYADAAEAYDRRWREYLRVTIDATLAALPSAAGASVLDIGCGTGLLLERLIARDPTARPTGVDVTPEMLAVARHRLGSRARLLLADGAGLPFPSGSFDLAATSSVLHHWTRPAAALAEIARVLEPGGVLVLTDWRADHVPTRLRDIGLRIADRSHRRVYTPRSARTMLEAAGFHIDSVRRYRLGWSWGLMTITARTAA